MVRGCLHSLAKTVSCGNDRGRRQRKKRLDFYHPFEKENEFPVNSGKAAVSAGRGAAAFQVKNMEEPHGSRFQ